MEVIPKPGDVWAKAISKRLYQVIEHANGHWILRGLGNVENQDEFASSLGEPGRDWRKARHSFNGGYELTEIKATPWKQ